MKQKVVSEAAQKEEQARLWVTSRVLSGSIRLTVQFQFAQIRAVLDEKEKEWAVKLKEMEASKLSANNVQLERLTWVTEHALKASCVPCLSLLCCRAVPQRS